MVDVTLMQLASNSPRRRELMALGSWRVQSCAPEVDESRQANEAPADYVRRLAGAKARAALPFSPSDAYIVAADTAVVDGAEVLGKPIHPEDAERMLRQLRGRTHQVFTGVTVIEVSSGTTLTDVCITDVPMRDYTDAEILSYVASGDPMDKAGAYGIQHAGFHPVRQMRGCFASVMGLPLCHVVRLMRRLRAALEPELPERCQSHLNYVCPVSAAILRGEPVG
ncbi:MAG TPA: Maf family protein [Anaerolineales bacterium]|nr:Maf family protein [Anaerolineales bacterium]